MGRLGRIFRSKVVAMGGRLAYGDRSEVSVAAGRPVG